MNTQTLLIAAAAAFIGYKILSSKKSSSSSGGSDGGGTQLPDLGAGAPTPTFTVATFTRPLLWTDNAKSAVYVEAETIYRSLPLSKKSSTPSNVLELASATAKKVWPSYEWPKSQAELLGQTPQWLLNNPVNARGNLAEIWAQVYDAAEAIYSSPVGKFGASTGTPGPSTGTSEPPPVTSWDIEADILACMTEQGLALDAIMGMSFQQQYELIVKPGGLADCLQQKAWASTANDAFTSKDKLIEALVDFIGQ